MDTPHDLVALLQALHFAASKHRDQRRKGAEASPYINHPIELAELLTRLGGITDLVTLQAAILHDTLEDTQTTPVELEAIFGPEVCQVIERPHGQQATAQSRAQALGNRPCAAPLGTRKGSQACR